ncbi:7TMR-DISMED2 domain-containing protein [Niabella hibiscisoli]|uniref:7TMR-DISMED2 domain-containing protein n=1 Tax=Niabella hibiscisoli TaxID=1825928 RepID=UPI001F0D50DC|nr:7TM-DISM domain-containing protein [Niabella hibiscisoli]MCH5719585.1 hypothetical protein [Niabella hibiscisoli]
MKWKYFLFLLLALLCATFSWSRYVNLDQGSPARYIGSEVVYFKDTTAALSLPQVQQAYKEGRFIKGANDILNFGNTPDAVWVHLALRKTGNNAAYLVVGYANIEQVDCYVGSGSRWNHLKAGSLIAASPGVRSTNQYIFPINAREGQDTVEVWLRSKTRNIMLLPLQVAGVDNLYAIENSNNRTIELCFVGFLLRFSSSIYFFTLQ